MVSRYDGYKPVRYKYGPKRQYNKKHVVGCTGLVVLVLFYYFFFRSQNEFIAYGSDIVLEPGDELLSMKKNSELNGPDLRVIVLAEMGKHPIEFRKALHSLKAAYYGNDRVDLNIFIDYTQGTVNIEGDAVVMIARDFKWSFGELHVTVNDRHKGKTQQILDCWPYSLRATGSRIETTQEKVLMLEHHVEVSPAFWTWLKRAHAVYGDRPEIAGFSLERLDICAAHGCKRLNGGPMSTGLMLYPVVGSWAFSPTGSHWQGFLKWFEDSESKELNMPNLIYTDAFKKAHDYALFNWIMYHIKYTFEHTDRYTVYAKLKEQTALASSMAETRDLHGSVGKKYKVLQRSYPELSKFVLIPPTLDYDGKIVSACMETAKQLNKQHGLFNMQLLNQGYVTMTKSWVCNAEKFPEVLPATLLVTTDTIAYRAMLKFNKKLNVCFQQYKTESELAYGNSDYYWLMNWRTSFILSLLKDGVNVFLTEADATWIGSPFPLLQGGYDVIVCDNHPPSKTPNGGFMFLRSTENTIAAWSHVYSVQTRNNYLKVFGGRDEQGIEKDTFMQYSREGKIRLKFLPPDVVSAGTWYEMQPELRTENNVVVLNNFIDGNKAKIERAKKWNQWFLSEDETQCLP